MTQLQTTRDGVAKLWGLCDGMCDDVAYHQYVTGLTYLPFFKMGEETGSELPLGYRWRDLRVRYGLQQLDFDKAMLHLGTDTRGVVQGIYANANRMITNPTTLVNGMDNLDWCSARSEGLGDLYESLLELGEDEAALEETGVLG
ncbi:type I restriction-modification system subunit M [Deinococcus radiopugnans]|uniref:SAM-dependent DNA methyltransferase n=1 Tax=Deinococcus radiopugnans ATCC 19172 TaxID=585398 RepID=A0A5C4Y6Q2_9DEIO|nr:type I restriction-modification system subunit M [Deinococcus radiopugnans]MBB6016929.1 type I restriction-modification system DNA methylase subunit [Deinococcus radiopugnans ATCC 19172]TNM71482.1 SAM-dependent DNA methyltransferase [Deinococcus radiopugnans ATCC 19172]